MNKIIKSILFSFIFLTTTLWAEKIKDIRVGLQGSLGKDILSAGTADFICADYNPLLYGLGLYLGLNFDSYKMLLFNASYEKLTTTREYIGVPNKKAPYCGGPQERLSHTELFVDYIHANILPTAKFNISENLLATLSLGGSWFYYLYKQRISYVYDFDIGNGPKDSINYENTSLNGSWGWGIVLQLGLFYDISKRYTLGMAGQCEVNNLANSAYYCYANLSIGYKLYRSDDEKN